MSFQYGDFETEFIAYGLDGKMLYKFTTWRVDNAKKAAKFLGRKLYTDSGFSSFEQMVDKKKLANFVKMLNNNTKAEELSKASVNLTNIRPIR